MPVKKKDFSKQIMGYALKNCIEYGKTEPGKILPKLFQHGLKKSGIGKVMPEIQEIVKKVNSLSKKEREKEFEKHKKYLIEKEEKEKDIPELDVSGLKSIVTRMAPEPSKYNHLGHALTFLLNYIYAKKYGGKCLLRFEDANPEKVSQEYIDAMKEDVLDYLKIKPDGIRYVSDDMPLMYKYAEKLIKMGKAYMCFCEREKMQDLRHKGIECGCRGKDPETNLDEWKKFISKKYKEGECVLRIKGDMKSENHVMRDSVIFRYVKAKHYKYKDKYKVWPMYDFYNPIEDSLMGITLILRSNEFDMRIELQDLIKDLLGLKKQKIIQYGRFNVEDFTTKGREIRKLVESGELIGWDDPRLITLKALKRRGIKKESFYELVKQVGLSKHQVNLNFDMIAALNRKIIDAQANRYFFVKEPVQLIFKNKLPSTTATIPMHPDKPDKIRKIKLGKILISKEDFEKYKDKEIRLLHLFNVKFDSSGKAEITSLENKDIPKIQWVSAPTPVKILMPDGSWILGKAESAIKNLKVNEVMQFERFGFVRFDAKNKNTYEFWFAHK